MLSAAWLNILSQLISLDQLPGGQVTTLCTSCGHVRGEFVPSLHGVYCLRCAAELKRLEAARSDLTVMLEPMVALWRTHWMALGVTEKEALELFKDVVPVLFGGERIY